MMRAGVATYLQTNGPLSLHGNTAFLGAVDPSRGSPIETVFRHEVYYALKALDPNYQDWMVTVNYEVERKIVSR
jgi:hypothetical protein